MLTAAASVCTTIALHLSAGRRAEISEVRCVGRWYFLAFANLLVIPFSVDAQEQRSRNGAPVVSATASIDCAAVSANSKASTVARVLCSGRDGAAADWDLNAALSAISGSNDKDQNKKFDQDQDLWRGRLNTQCGLQSSANLDPTAEQRKCVIAAVHERADFLRSRLSGDIRAESEMSSERHAEIQMQLRERGFFSGQATGEFGTATRDAIRRFQLTLNAAPTGFLSTPQINSLAKDSSAPPSANLNVVETAPKAPDPPPAAPRANASLKLCSDAIDDPLRPMIIDMLVSGGKHLGGGLKTVKGELEEDYGAYLTLENDAIVEKIDRETGKVGCSVTYSADIKGLAAKVLNDGATRRAKILIDQMSRQGATVERRVRYTVQQTSGGSLVVWFGLVEEARARTARCVFAYGGVCLAYR